VTGDLVGGVDIGGTKVAVGLVRKCGAVLGSRSFATPQTGRPADLVKEAVAALRSLSASTPGSFPSRIGIAVPGPVDEEGLAGLATNVEGWANVDVQRLFREETGSSVWAENDANAAALACRHFHLDRGADPFAFVAIGTGIGAGLMVGDKLIRGYQGLAGEIGHLCVQWDGPACRCGRRGCLEALASGPAYVRAARDVAEGPAGRKLLSETGGRPERITTEMVFRLARQGDAACLEIVERLGTILGVGLAGLASVLGPELILLGGGLARAWDQLRDPVLSGFSRCGLPHALGSVAVAPVDRLDEMGVLAAATVALLGREDRR